MASSDGLWRGKFAASRQLKRKYEPRGLVDEKTWISGVARHFCD